MKKTAQNHAGFSRHPFFLRQGLLALLTVLLGLPGISQAQIPPPPTPITSSGLNTVVTTNGNIHDITGGTRPGGGANLFHSFGEFGVPANNIANFLNAGSVDRAGNPLAAGLPTSNILGRVTGGNVSNIFGTIQTTNFGNANLFLLNPNGFLFGPNATVNVGGMVAFTSADYLKLADNKLFTALPSSHDALLSAAPVAAFGFLALEPGVTRGAISVQGSNLSVVNGQTIGLVGGNISIESGTPEGGTAQPAQLSAPNGKIQLASAASPGEFDAATLQPLPNVDGTVDGTSFTSFGSVSLAPGSNINVSGENTVSIRGGQFVLSVNDAVLTTRTGAGNAADSVTLSNGSSISAFGFGAGGAGDIAVVSRALTMRDASFIVTASFGEGNAGNISLNVGALDLANASIQSVALAGGRGGDIGITSNGFTTNSYTISEGGFVSTDAFGVGSAGNITLNAGSLTLNTGEIRTATGDAGSAGNISITTSGGVSLLAGSSFSRISSFSTGTGPAGDVTLNVGSLNVSPNSTIEIQTANGDTTGTLHIDSSGPITVSGVIWNLGLGPALVSAGPIEITAPTMTLNNGSIATQISGDGRAGDILLQVGNLHINGASRIDTTTVGAGRGGDINITSDFVSLSGAGSGLFSDAQLSASGPGGDIHVQAQQVEITDGAVISAKSTGSGAAGSVTIEGTQSPAQSVLIDGPGSGIFTDTQGTGAGGDIFVNANTVTLQNGGTFSAKTSGTEPTATGGSITVTATDAVTMTGGASITASSTGPADAGYIKVNAGQSLDLRDSSIKTEAAQASGGNIDIRAVDRVRLVNSSISTSVLGGSGNGGNITIDPNVVVLQNSQVIAQAVQGAGGNITITTPLFLADASSLVNASSQFGLNGTVTIQSPTSNLSGSLGPLTSKPSEAQSLLTQRCAALANGQASSFVVAGREQLPSDPGGWLSGPIALAGIDAERIGDGIVAKGTSHLAPRTSGLLANDRVSLRRLTPAGFLIANFADSEATGCHS